MISPGPVSTRKSANACCVNTRNPDSGEISLEIARRIALRARDRAMAGGERRPDGIVEQGEVGHGGSKKAAINLACARFWQNSAGCKPDHLLTCHGFLVRQHDGGAFRPDVDERYASFFSMMPMCVGVAQPRRQPDRTSSSRATRYRAAAARRDSWPDRAQDGAALQSLRCPNASGSTRWTACRACAARSVTTTAARRSVRPDRYTDV